MLEAGHRRRNLPAPPHIVHEALTRPDRDPSRPWLHLLPDASKLGHLRYRINLLVHGHLRGTFGQ